HARGATGGKKGLHMCGITGILNLDKTPVSPRLLKEMTNSLTHRGPDETDLWIDRFAGLGHRRLSIIDLQTGKQPMSDRSKKIWITYNGELYNFLELKKILESKGHTFRTNSDTEVIIYAYLEWGDRCVEKFRGMFAFAIADLIKKRLFLARDHFGIKPFYYYLSGGVFAFSSEIQALLKIKKSPLTLDFPALDRYLQLQYIPAPGTIFREIKKLKPAHCMNVSFDGKVSPQKEYWQLDFKPDPRPTQEERLEALEEVLRESVRAHLVSDVPYGAFLSGGVDSSAVVAYMSQIMNRPVKTFTIGFEEDEYSEIQYAAAVAKKWGTEHHVEIVKPDALSILPDLVKHYGEPFGDSSAVPTYYVAKMAREHVTMVLSGDGGDETFGGYRSYQAWMNWLHFCGMPGWKKFVYPLASILRPNRYPRRLPTLTNWLSFIQYINEKRRKMLWRGEYLEKLDFRLDFLEADFAKTAHYDLTNKVQYLDFKTYLPYDILTKVDAASMMSSLEVRTPLVDKEVVEFAAGLPQAVNIAPQEDGKFEGKLLLKTLMRKYYPEEFVRRPKMGFAVPLFNWFSSKDALQDVLTERLLSSESRVLELFRPRMVKKLIAVNEPGPIWLLLFLEEWLKQNREHIAL
ncbi:MAG: asparagine synthase (glutamine-hydrolyzing), partial [Candidatus Aminicenantes bacterium]|nr:asparagine synthase (glutamine-hydrolyzing) [Candidatus Aminicenantes bacterium]